MVRGSLKVMSKIKSILLLGYVESICMEADGEKVQVL